MTAIRCVINYSVDKAIPFPLVERTLEQMNLQFNLHFTGPFLELLTLYIIYKTLLLNKTLADDHINNKYTIEKFGT